MPIRFDQPIYLLLLLLAVPVVLSGTRALRAFEPTRRWTAIGARLVLLFALTLMLAGFQSVRRHEGLAVIAVIDESESVSRVAEPPATLPDRVLESIGLPETNPSMTDWMRGWLHVTSRDRRPDDQLGLVTFDGRPTVQQMPTVTGTLDRGAANAPREGTDAAAALRLAMAMFGPDTSRRIVLASDGNDTSITATTGGRLIEAAGPVGGQADIAASELLAVAREAAAARIPIDVMPIEYQATDEVMIDGVYLPTEVRLGQTVDVRVVMRGTAPMPGMLYLKQDEQVVDLSGGTSSRRGAPITARDWRPDAATDGYMLVYRAQVPTRAAGVAQFEAIFEAERGSDRVTSNNHAESFVKVHGSGSVMLVKASDDPGDGVLADALRSHGINVVEGKASDIPNTIGRIQPLDAILFDGVAEAEVPKEQQELIAEYVNELGGGFAMIGGPHSFGAGGWTDTVIDRLLPVECRVPDKVVLPAGALVLIIDRSGSMNDKVPGVKTTKQQIANEAAALAVKTLYPNDFIGVMAFDTSATWVVQVGVHDHDLVSERIHGISSGGGTAIFSALAGGFQGIISSRTKGAAVRHVVLLTDGQGAGGDYAGLLKLFRENKVSLSTIGVGRDIDRPLLEMLAEKGNGKFYAVDDPTTLPEIFMREALVVRRTLIREKPFAPVIRPDGSPVMAGIRSAPMLDALVITGPKDRPTIYLPMLSEDGDPLFAHWQVGLGRTAAFTSDASSRWAGQWLEWQGYVDFWSRLVRRIARPPASRDYELVSTVRGSSLHVQLDTGAADSGADRVVGRVMRPSGETVSITLEQTAPGVFEATTPADEPGNYVVSVLAANAAGGRTYAFGGANRPTGSELRAFKSNRDVLEQIAAITGGRVLDPASSEAGLLFERTEGMEPTRSIQPMWRPLLIVVLVAFLLDVAMRRLTWNASTIRAAVRRMFTTHDAQAGETLTTLRTKSKLAPAQAVDLPEPQELARERRRERRRQQYEDARAAADAVTMKPPGSTATATADPPKPAEPPMPTKPKDKPDPKPDDKPSSSHSEAGGLSARLLAAKRRAREDMDES